MNLCDLGTRTGTQEKLNKFKFSDTQIVVQCTLMTVHGDQ